MTLVLTPSTLFETLLIENGQPVWVTEHLERLKKSAARSGFSTECIPENLNELMIEWIQKSAMTHGAMNWYLIPDANPPVFHIRCREMGPTITHVTLQPDPFPRSERDEHKWALGPRTEWAKTHLKPGEDALLYGPDGHVLESTRANVFFVKKGHIFTPPAMHILPGILRGKLIQEGTQERPIHIDELPEFDEMFMTNSLRGIFSFRL